MENNIINRTIALISLVFEKMPMQDSSIKKALEDIRDNLFELKNITYASSEKLKSLHTKSSVFQEHVEFMERYATVIHKYECCKLPAGTFVYQHRDVKNAHAPYGYFCPHCMHQIGASTLKVVLEKKRIILECAVCSASFTYKK